MGGRKKRMVEQREERISRKDRVEERKKGGKLSTGRIRESREEEGKVGTGIKEVGKEKGEEDRQEGQRGSK